MQFFPDPQTFLAFKLGSLSFSIRWYAVLIMTGALLAYYVSRKDVRKARYIDGEFFDSFFVYTLWAGIIGARIWFCVFYNFSYYLSDPIEIIRVWDGGLAIQGGIVFGAVFACWYAKKNRYSFLKLLDIALPNVLIGQGIGRWGNFVNKECHGGEVSEEFFNGILSFLKDGMYINGHYYEPLFFYESLLCLFGWALIHFVLKKYQNKRGDLAYAYLMWYGVIRFFIEGRRTDSLYFGNFKMAQLTSIAFLIIGLLGYFGAFQKLLMKYKPPVIFDFDGTLVDTTKSIEEGYRYLFKKYSSEDKFSDEIRNEIIGPALRDLFPKYFPGVDYDTLYKDYHARQVEVAVKSNHPLPNCEQVLKTLHEQGYKVGIISTRSNEGIREILNTFDLEKYVDDVCGLKDVEKLKPDPEGLFKLVNKNKWNREVIMVGDSLMDMDCGYNYGAYRVAYLNDEKRFEEMKAASNTAISDLIEVLDIVKKDIAFTYDEK